ncbi:MAG: hypothetical protein AAF387_09610 [Pseudomonadota bacterium]
MQIWSPFLIQLLLLLSAASLTGCAGLFAVAPHHALPSGNKDCLSLFSESDAYIRSARTGDAQYARIEGYPFLRINRFYEALRSNLKNYQQKQAWVSSLGTLDKTARDIEIKNAARADANALTAINRLDQCRQKLITELFKNDASYQTLVERAVVPDNYQLTQRILGFYFATQWPVRMGVAKLHMQHSPSQTPVKDSAIVSYKVESTEDYQHLNFELTRDFLGIPLLNDEVVEALFERYAPVWSVATRSEADRIGQVKIKDDRVEVSSNRPSVYRHISHALFGQVPLVQLNYTIWFPRVPAANAMDIYAGEIDGLTFRVNLDENLQPLLADLMHNCGCYYMAFPSAQLRKKPPHNEQIEALWVPFNLPNLTPGKRYSITLDSGRHFVNAFSVADLPENALDLKVEHYDSLRQLPIQDGGTQSAFSPRGLIENSERLERFVLFPMGVLSAGAMRQVGTHAIAFVGRRHFDDPGLIEKNFVRTRD